ncbi:hypothetical protein HOY82DRAFT_640456 [Tuber indicum]|nr:hypothetical protein HOY82DRAFT_640456 [Tuber indicum]
MRDLQYNLRAERPSAPGSLDVLDPEWDQSTSDEGRQDGGLRGWLHVMGVHIAMFNAFGYAMNCLESRSHYAERWAQSPSRFIWIVVAHLVGIFIGMCVGHGPPSQSFRRVYTVATLARLIAAILGYYSQNVATFFLLQGIIVGVSNVLISCYAVELISPHFCKTKHMAIGLALAGAPTGGALLPLVVQRLAPRIGFPWTHNVVVIISAVTMLCANLLLRPVPRQPKDGDIQVGRDLTATEFPFGFVAFKLG